jgi:hypothetical protein
MNRIATIGNVHQEENPETKQMEYVPVFTLELVNNIQTKNPDKDIDLKFGQSPAAYESLFKKDLTFTNEEEMDACRNFLMELKRLDGLDRDYAVIYSGYNNSIVILINGGETQYFKFPNTRSYTYICGILHWITEQERYF